MIKKIFCAVLLLAVSFIAHADQCRNLDANSCWHVINNASTNGGISCSGYGETNMFQNSALSPAQTYSVQYSMGWGDGLGFPEPNIAFNCTAQLNGKQAKLVFSTMGWGDRIKFVITESAVALTIKTYWGTPRVVEKSAAFN
jgi:hypothetical protein